MARSGKETTICDNCGNQCEYLGDWVELDRTVAKKTVTVRTAYGSPDLCTSCLGAILTSAVRVRYEQTWFPFIVATACAWSLLVYVWIR